MKKMMYNFENIMHPGPEINPKCYSFGLELGGG